MSFSLKFTSPRHKKRYIFAKKEKSFQRIIIILYICAPYTCPTTMLQLQVAANDSFQEKNKFKSLVGNFQSFFGKNQKNKS